MHRVEQLERLLAQAVARGFIVRQEWLGGRGGGAAEIAGQRYLFLDLALNVTERLELVVEALRGEPEQAAASGRRNAA